MKKAKLLLFLCSVFMNLHAQKNDLNIEAIKRFYPQVIDYKDNKIIFNDGTAMIYDDMKPKNQ